MLRTLGVTLALTANASAFAAEPSNAWQIEVMPYLWATGMKGDVEAGSLPRISADMSFSDILDVLDFGLMGTLEARKGRWGVVFDAIYMKVSDSATVSRTGPGPIGAAATASADAQFEQTMLAGAVAYRLSEGPSAFDVLAGLRYNKVDVSADIAGSFFGLSGSTTRSGDKDWVDPYIALRVQHPIANRWTLTAYADIGGFGVGADSTWQGALGVKYDMTRSVSASFGYRYLKVDYDKDGFLYDMANSGVYAGVSIRF
jgi:hypothetical protein